MQAVDIGIFAHNEAHGIGAMLADLARQSLLTAPGLSVRVLVLANGCKDNTIPVAQATAFAGVEVVDLPLGGKSRTWNRFVHDLSRPDAGHLIFCDADIALPDTETLLRLVQTLIQRPDLAVVNSRPVKDIIHTPQPLSATDRLIASGTGGLDDWKSAICGQLYAMPTTIARRYHLPIGLPVEDGFLRAMVLTDATTEPTETLPRIDGAEGAFHVYASERSISALLRHQTRIVIGSAVNTACFTHLHAQPITVRHVELARAAADEDWLPRVLRQQLPRRPFGYVPFHFATKRLERAAREPGQTLKPKRLITLIMGLIFDLIVYCGAQIRMARGSGAGFW